MPRALFAAAAIWALGAGGCARPPAEPLELQGNRLTVHNRTSEEWTNVEIWLNRQFRVTVRSIPAGGRFDVALDSFVAGFGQRFNFRRMQITDLRLAARRPDGQRLDLRKAFEKSGLAGALGGRG